MDQSRSAKRPGHCQRGRSSCAVRTSQAAFLICSMLLIFGEVNNLTREFLLNQIDQGSVS
jgi:hypothetical protein